MKDKFEIMRVSSRKADSFSDDRFRATRPLDYIYDPLFTFSGPKDYYRTAHESYQSASEFSVQPIFSSMFSDMVRYPRATLVLRPSHHIPQSIDSSYKGKIKAISQERTVTTEVTGTDRYKYFRRPVTETQPGSPSITRFPLLGVDLGIMAPPTTAQKLRERSSATQVRSTQTDYRETETQTQPWTPPYVTRSSTTPEVLYLDQLTWGNGLPPGQHEVDIVEHLRKKQAWEAQLPPLDTEANIKKRFKLIAEMEKSDWEFREKEVQAIHDERMKKSEQLLEQHVQMNRTRLSYRMEFLEDDINKRKERKLQLFRHDKERALRKLRMKEKGYNLKYHKMNVVDEHLRHTSEIFAPMRRYGTSFKNRHEILAEKHIVIDEKDISSLGRAVEFQPTFDFNKASQPKKQTELCVRETRWTMENLTRLHKDLQTLRAKEEKKGDAFYTQIIEQLPKPPKKLDVESVPLTQESRDKLYQAAIMIQRVVKGRAMQTQMYQGRERWKEVLEELKSTEGMTTQQLLSLKAHKDHVNLDSRLVGMLENIIGLNVGMSIGQTLYLLATELLRFKNEGIAHSQALQSECARFQREVPECGRRQKEVRRREEHNLMFAQLLQVYQDSINQFLEDLVIRAREHEAKSEALDYAKEVALLAELERAAKQEPVDNEPVSADLLFELIAPEGLRQLAHTCMLILKQKYTEARECLVQTGRAKPLSEDGSQHKSEVTSAVEPSTATISFHYSEDILGSSSQTRHSESDLEPTKRFGLVPPVPPEERLLARVMRDMCYMSGALLHTAADILNKALHLSDLPQATFEEALRRTMLVINEVREEIARLILPKHTPEVNLLPSKIASEEIMLKASKTVDSIISKARERIEEAKKTNLLKMASTGHSSTVPRVVIESEIQSQAKQLVEDVVNEAQQKVFQAVVQDFLADLLKEATTRVDFITGDSYFESP